MAYTKSDDRGPFTRLFFPDGKEPDPRFTLANERTFLAWTRTSLAFLAGGIALEAFPLGALSDTARSTLAVIIIGVGVAIAAGAATRWVRVERAMRHKKPLPAPAIVPILSLGALVPAVFMIYLAITS